MHMQSNTFSLKYVWFQWGKEEENMLLQQFITTSTVFPALKLGEFALFCISACLSSGSVVFSVVTRRQPWYQTFYLFCLVRYGDKEEKGREEILHRCPPLQKNATPIHEGMQAPLRTMTVPKFATDNERFVYV